MNNLKQLRIRFLPVHDIKGEIIHVSIEGKEEVFYLRKDCLVHVDLSKAEECIIVSDIQDVIHAEYLAFQNKISISTKRSILIVDCDTKEVFEKELDVIQQTAWNHSCEYVAVLFQNGQLRTYFLNEQCDLLEHSKGDIFALVPQRQSVGWGSESSQFQGPTKVSPESGNGTGPHQEPTDNGVPVISWRHNADEFVVSFMKDGLRIFKAFNYDCVPTSTSELSSEIGKLYGPIAWKLEGYMIAAAMYKDNKNCVALFEKNGLYQLDFPLVDIFYPITRLSWSPCGKTLAVAQEDDAGIQHLSFYITCNKKWYLKQHFKFHKNNRLITFNWMQTDPMCLELQTVTKTLVTRYKYRFGFDTDSRHNMIAAVNGKTILVHGFSESVDPSPTCTSQYTVANPINMLAFHPSDDFLAVVDSSSDIYCYKINGIELVFLKQYAVKKDTFPLRVNHLFWKGENPHFLVDFPSDCYASLCEFCIESEKLVEVQKFDATQHAVEHIYAVDNMVVKHDAKYRTTHRVTETPVVSVNMNYALEVLPFKSESEIVYFVLTPEQDLYLDDHHVCSGVTSIILYKDFLLLTNTTHLYTLKLNGQTLDMLPMEGLSLFHSRPLNEVAYLMCMLSDTSQVILHTPRGNLEIIGCRPMQVRFIEDMLSKGEWGAAIRFMRLSRTNWNLLIDLNPDRFYANLPQVVSESNSQHTLNAIVAEISDENCLTTVYKNTIDLLPYTSPTKRQDFLTKLSEYLDDSGKFVEYLSTVIKVCMDQSNVKKALTYLSILTNSPKEKERRKAEQVLKQMKMHVEPMDLFKAALFTYNISLAEYVARLCQINPQEVSPILEELKKLDTMEVRIAINVRYKNWEMAVAFMINDENRDKEEILKFIKEHNVAKKAYLEAIKVKDLEFMEDIALLYADKLIGKKHHNEAAMILIKYCLFDEAVEQFKLALDHKKCIEYMSATSLTQDARKQLFIDLAEKLVAAQRFEDAAMIHETQLEDYETAVKVLTNGKVFTEALRVAKAHALVKLIDTLILPKMYEVLQGMQEIVEETTLKFKKRLERLTKLRNQKKHEFYLQSKPHTRLMLMDPYYCNNEGTLNVEPGSNLDIDIQSVISSGSGEDPPFFDSDSDSESNATVRTHRSSRSSGSSKSNTSSSTTVTQKQIRKMEKQRQDITEGSKFEDIALMRELHLMISLIFQFGPEAKEVISRLIEYSTIELSILHKHHQKLYNLQVLMSTEVHNIWDEEFRSGTTVNYINQNYSYMDEKFRVIPPEVNNPGLSWALEMFKE